MSEADPSTALPPGVDPEDPRSLLAYFQDNPLDFFDVIGVEYSATQRRIVEAIEDHDRVLVLSGNGTGKTAGVTMAAYHFWLTAWNALVLFTSGNYDILKDTSFPFLQTLHNQAQERLPVPGTVKQSPPRMEVADEPEWFLRYASPRHPENLQGRHARRAMVVIEEADKPDVTEAHFDAATSTASSAEDVVVAVANPPESRSNPVYSKMESDRWEVVQFSSFDSHNAVRETDQALMLDGDPRGEASTTGSIPGLVDTDVIGEDFAEWHGRELPDVGTIRSHVRYDPSSGYWEANDDLTVDLDPRWYRTRLGVMPPSGSDTLRPWYERHVDAAIERWREAHDPRNTGRRVAPDAPVAQTGVDIARGGGDRTGIVDRHQDATVWPAHVDRVGDHARNRELVEDHHAESDTARSWVCLVDAVGEGSGVADELRRRLPTVRRFEAGANAADDGDYYDARTEALVELGSRLKSDLKVPPDTVIARELRAAARTLYLEERTLRGGTVLRAKGKEDLKDPSRLGRSPDALDATMLACYTAKNRGDAVIIDPGGVTG